MNADAAIALAQHAVELARAAGAGACEATVSGVQRFHAEARGAIVSKLERSTGRALRVRVFVGTRRAALNTTDLSPEGIRDAIARTVAQAAFVAEDEFTALPDTLAADCPDLDLHDPAVESLDDAHKVEEALEMERLIRAADSRIANSNGSHFTDAATITAIANSAGFAAAYAGSRAGRSTGPIALDGETRRTAHYGTAARFIARMETLHDVAYQAVARAVESFGARKPPTERLPIIFERDVAAGILDDVLSAVSASNIATGNSWLIGRTGERVGSDLVTIVDDGRMPGLIGSSPFDGEGVSTQRTSVFEGGVLASYLYDTYYARKLGAKSTGNSNGAGIGSNNFYLEAGTATLEDLIASTRRGILVLDTIGFATEHASGTYSRGARGIFIENGERRYPVDEFTIAGTYAEMLAGIDAVANDLRFDAAVVSPSFRVAEMTVSGN